MSRLAFPTEEHAAAASAAAAWAHRMAGVDTVLVVNSCARGVAVAASDLDMAVLFDHPVDDDELDAEWRAYCRADPMLNAFWNRSAFSAIHLDFFDGTPPPFVWDEGGGPDDFEIAIGNWIAYAVPLGDTGAHFAKLRQQWLPYYDDDLRRARIVMIAEACRRDLEFIPFYVERDLTLQAFDRLYKAFREYLQLLFVVHRTYPLAYNKWLREQLGWIGRADRTQALLELIGVDDLRGRAKTLEAELLAVERL